MRAALLVLLVLLGLLTAVPTGAASEAGVVDTNSTASAAAQTDAPPDPEEDVIGWENGVWYNESIPVDQSGQGDIGLSGRETELLVARTMARVEVIRGLEFTEEVTVEFISRTAFRDRLANTSFGETTSDQVYEGMFVFGEDTDAETVIEGYLGDAVVGFAAEEGAANLTIVTRAEGLHAVSESVLAHELVHVLQDQHFDLQDARYERETLDGEWGKDGLIEGEAAYVDSRFTEQCQSNWSCTDPPENWSGATVPKGVYTYSLLSSQPYQDGATFVFERIQDGGWEAVDEAHMDPPTSSEQIIHRDPGEAVEPLSVEDRSAASWEHHHSNTIGEAGMFAMFVAHRQRVEDGKEVLDRDPFEHQHRWDTVNFVFEPTAGWGNDVFRAYRNGEERGFTWTSVWDTERDSREFAAAYEKALSGLGAREYDEDTYVIEQGPFADAFHVTREERTVRIVNAPGTDDLEGVDSRVDVEPDRSSDRPHERAENQNETIESLRTRLEEKNETIADLRERLADDEEQGVTVPFSPGLVIVAIIGVALVVLGRRRGGGRAGNTG